MEKEEEQHFTLEFIEVYRSLPALWDIKSKDYANRNSKNDQCNILLTKYKERYPDADKTAVIKKNNCLRTAYRQYRKKVGDLERSGVGVDEESWPTLFYADALEFLNDADKPRESRTSMAIPMPLGESERVSKKKKPSDSCDALLDIAAQKLLKPQDDQAKMGEVYAAKLRKMSPEQQLYADRFINDFLFEGQLGKLHRDSIILRRSRASTPYSQHSPLTADSETRFTFTSGENVAIPMSQRSGLGNTVQSSGEQYYTTADNSQETAAEYFMNFSES